MSLGVSVAERGLAAEADVPIKGLVFVPVRSFYWAVP